MSETRIIPNVIRRIDVITEAIRAGRRSEARQLTILEWGSLSRKRDAISSPDIDVIIANIEANAVKRFVFEVIDCNSAWLQARRECGWKGDDQ